MVGRGSGKSRAYFTYASRGASEVARERGTDRACAPCASIKRLYESRDSKLCVFEDRSGHVVAVRASRLA